MSKTERIAWINRRLKENKSVTAVCISERFEVSEKTAKRDIEYLRDRCEAPVAWNAGAHSYEFTAPWNGLDFLDEHSLLAAAFLKAILGQFNYVPVVADSLEEEFVEQLPDDYRSIVESIHYELPQFERIPDTLVAEICRALRKRLRLRITYVDSRDDRTDRDIEPRRLINYSGKWYTIAFDHQRKALRTFALSRIVAYSLTETSFLVDEASGVYPEMVDEFVSSVYGIYKGVATGTAVLRFFGGAANNIRHSTWHPDQTMREYTDGENGPAVELSLPVHDYPELLGRALRCGVSCEVVSPPEFREKWKEEIRKMARLAEKKE